MNRRVIVVLAGMIGAGKSTAARYLATHYQIEHRSFVESIWIPILRERGLEVSRRNLQLLGVELMRDRGAGSIVLQMLATLDSAVSYAIDDVRSPSIYRHVTDIEPTSKLIYIDAIFAARFPRLQRRDNVESVDEQVSAEKMPTELEIENLRSYAWRVIENNGSDQQFKASLDQAADALGLRPR